MPEPLNEPRPYQWFATSKAAAHHPKEWFAEQAEWVMSQFLNVAKPKGMTTMCAMPEGDDVKMMAGECKDGTLYVLFYHWSEPFPSGTARPHELIYSPSGHGKTHRMN